MDFENYEEAFKELDKKEHVFFSRALGGYLKSLMQEGFTRREAFRLVEAYARFVYDMSIEEFISQKQREELGDDIDDDLEDEDEDDEDPEVELP